MYASGARDETRAPMITPGTLPINNDAVRSSSKSPHRRRPDERAGNRAAHQPPDDSGVHGSTPEVDPATDRLHHDRGDEVARDGCERFDTEPDDENRCHERAAAHAGETDDEPDEQPCECDPEVDVHAVPAPEQVD